MAPSADVDPAREFLELVEAHPEMPTAVAAFTVLLNVMRANKATTMMELRQDLMTVSDQLAGALAHSISLSSACDLFGRFMVQIGQTVSDFADCKQKLIARAKTFVDSAAESRSTIAKLGMPFIRDGATILVHSRSRVVLRLLCDAAKDNKRRFRVYVTESRPDGAGYRAAEALQQMRIPCSVVLDAAVGFIMDRVDFVLVGAEGVVESGGIINKIGTYQIAVVAKALNKPLYAVAESYKFLRLYPLRQHDVAGIKSQDAAVFVPPAGAGLDPDLVDFVDSTVDYTPPTYVTLLFTDLGVLTPSAVSDELIKLYA